MGHGERKDVSGISAHHRKWTEPVIARLHLMEGKKAQIISWNDEAACR